MKLLLCDSHAVFTESLALVLEQAGYDVVALTRTPDEAAATLAHTPADVCVIDVGESPPDVIARLVEVRAAAPDTRIVLLCPEPDAAVASAATALGVDGFAYKNQHVAELIDAIERVHRGETVAPPPVPDRPPAPAPQNDAQRLAAHLTNREREVLGHLVRGGDTNVVAKTMGVTWATARSHIQSVLSKLGVHSRVEAAAMAVRYGLISADTGDWLPV